MESPVVLDKPPEYHGNDVSGCIKQRLVIPDFGENFGGFDRFPFDDIPPEFREHFPSHWNRRFGSRDEAPPQPHAQGSPPTAPPHQHTAATQTEHASPAPTETEHLQTPLPQYGLRNTVDLGQKSPADPSLVDADERTHRSMSAPPDNRPLNDMSSQQPEHPPHAEHASNVRHIPIFVEGRDEPVINKADLGKPYSEPKQPFTPPQQPFTPPQQPHIDRDQYFADDGPASFHHQPNFSRAFGTPFNKGFRQGPQPFTQQKVYPQTAFTRGASPQRSQSPKQPAAPQQVPVHHEHAAPHTEAPSKPQPKQTPPPQPPQPQREQTPPQAPPKPCANDPITQILSIQTDVLNLMTEVENFTGSKKDKRYMFLDEMLTRNLIKLDNIETEGKENIRLARKEAIRCIQKCIAVLEAKAEKGSSTAQTQDVEMKESTESSDTSAATNGEIEMKEEKAVPPVDQVEPQADSKKLKSQMETQPQDEPKTQPEAAPHPTNTQSQGETKPSEDKPEVVEDKSSSEKKVVNKRDKSKDKAPADSAEAGNDSNKIEENVEVMKVEAKGDKTEHVMEVDGAASQ
ncbi:BAG domain-containing protein Samui [Operophtera brumata]|uniref:BAG domain-containing protein Samui n=1 Tax=Operophtera brumata TaxID=104452 RepID=A0A0L7LGQ6_OPEBR|nr:BAG domain-containing protein Samui [Operophtera brumata]